MKAPSMAQARELARIWASDRRTIGVCVGAPNGKAPYNNATTVALIKRGWLHPSGYPPANPFGSGYLQEPYILSWEGMKALASFIATEVRVSDNSAQETEQENIVR